MFAHVCNSRDSHLRWSGCYLRLCNTTLTARLSRSFYYIRMRLDCAICVMEPAPGAPGPGCIPGTLRWGFGGDLAHFGTGTGSCSLCPCPNHSNYLGWLRLGRLGSGALPLLLLWCLGDLALLLAQALVWLSVSLAKPHTHSKSSVGTYLSVHIILPSGRIPPRCH